jgi:hypothetical protein
MPPPRLALLSDAVYERKAIAMRRDGSSLGDWKDNQDVPWWIATSSMTHSIVAPEPR